LKYLIYLSLFISSFSYSDEYSSINLEGDGLWFDSITNACFAHNAYISNPALHVTGQWLETNYCTKLDGSYKSSTRMTSVRITECPSYDENGLCQYVTLCADGYPESIPDLSIDSCDRNELVSCPDGSVVYPNQICGTDYNSFDCLDQLSCTDFAENTCTDQGSGYLLEGFSYSDPINFTFNCIDPTASNVDISEQPDPYSPDLSDSPNLNTDFNDGCYGSSYKIYCDVNGYLAYGTGYSSSECSDGPEQIYPAQLCQDNSDLDPTNVSEDLLTMLVEQARLEHMTFSSMVESLDSIRREIVEATLKGTIDISSSINSQTNSIKQYLASQQQSVSDFSDRNHSDMLTLDASLNGVLDSISTPIVRTETLGFTDSSVRLESVKTEYQEKIVSIKSEMDSLFSFSSGVTNTLTCESAFEVFGVSHNICISVYQEQLSLISQGLVFASLVAAGLIMLGGVRV
jgi:hypothetical protein